MPALLLPDTAAPFAPRSSPTVVLNTKVDPWLTATLKRLNRIKRSLNSVPQHRKCLTDTLSQSSATWNLCTLMVPKTPASASLMDKSEDNGGNVCDRFDLLHVQAYVVHVDLVLSNEVAFKLTKDTINTLCRYHKEIYLTDQNESTWQWTEKEAQVKKLHHAFVQAINKFVYRTDAIALEGLEDDGAGELLNGRSDDVKNQILGLFYPLMPPPPRSVEQVCPQHSQQILSSAWWTPSVPSNGGVPPPPVEAWKILPSSPIDEDDSSSPPPQQQQSSSSCSPSYSNIWGPIGGGSGLMDSSCSSYSHLPQVTLSMPMPQVPLPSLVAQQCSIGSGFGVFGWDRFQDYAATM
jgi:hypothetical protein